MRIIIPFVFFFLICGLGTIYGQSVFKGKVIDHDSGEPLIGAALWLECQEVGTTTDVFGFYNLFIDTNSALCDMEVSYTGYQTVRIALDSLIDQQYIVALEPGVTFETVEISAARDNQQYGGQLSKLSVPVKTLSKIPNVFGEADIVKAMAYTPGVSTGFEGSSGLYIRGGSPDQNLIILDDATIYNGSHILGFMSSFNSDAISHFDVYKGDMPSKYGGRLSGVMDLRVKEGNKQDQKLSLTFSPIISKGILEQPLSEKTSLLLAGRTTLIDLFTLPLYNQYKNGNRSEYFGNTTYDINVKMHHAFSAEEALSISYFRSHDLLRIFRPSEAFQNLETVVRQSYGNEAFNLKYVNFISKSLQNNTSLVASDFSSKVRSLGNPSGGIFNNGESFNQIKSYALKSDFNYYLRHSKINFGLFAEHERFEPTMLDLQTPDGTSLEMVDLWDHGKKSYSYGLYTDVFLDWNNFQLQVGGRAWQYRIQDYDQFFAEPRVSLAFNADENTSLKVAYSRNNQAVQFLSSNGLTLPSDFWMPSVDVLPVSSMNIFSAGIQRDIGKKFHISLEGYYKTANNLIALKDGIDYYTPDIKIEDKLSSNGDGEFYGVEFFIEKEIGRFQGWIAYTWSKGIHTFSDVNQGHPFPAAYDKRHDLSVVGLFDLGKNWSLNSTLNYASGVPVTVPSALYSLRPTQFGSLFVGSEHVVHFDTRHNGRLEPTFRIDVSATKKFKRSSLSFGVYNLTLSQNPLYQTVVFESSADPDELIPPSRLQYRETSFFPLLPSISYRIDLK